MDHIHEDLLINFEFDSLHQNDEVSLESKLQKQRKTIASVKKLIISTDSLLKKYYNRIEALNQIERNLFETKNECKQLLKDKFEYQNSVLQLENERSGLLKQIETLEQTISHQEYCHSALKSNVEQLQSFSKDLELKYEAEALENKVKTISIKEKDNEINSLRKDVILLLQYLRFSCSIIRKNEKIPKKMLFILNKYKSNKTSDIEMSDDDEDDDEQKRQGFYLDKLAESAKLKIDIKQKELIDFDSEASNDVVCSEDTGRGSSVAFFSDSEKYLSPDYSPNINPIHPDQLTMNSLQKKVDKALSPIHFRDENRVYCSKSLSITYEQEQHLLKNPVVLCDNDTATITIHESEDQHTKNNPSIAVSDSDKRTVNESIFDPDTDHGSYPGEHNYPVDDALEINSNDFVPSSTFRNEERLCLESNDCSNINGIDENNEISNILRTMALHHNLMTPLPKSPLTVRPTSQIYLEDHRTHKENNKVQSDFMNSIEKLLSRKIKEAIELNYSQIVETFSNKFNENQNIMKSYFDKIYRSNAQIQMINNSVATESKTSNNNKEYIDQSNTCDVESDINDSNNHIDDDSETVHLGQLSDEETVYVIVPEENIDVVQEIEETVQQYSKNKTKHKIVESLMYEDSESDTRIDTSTANDAVTADVNDCLENYKAPCLDVSGKFEKQLRRKIKLSKLEKLRSKLIKKKNKIRSAELPPRKLRKRIIPFKSVEKNKTINCDSIADRNDKAAYNKALAVVAEVREKQKSKEHCGNKLHIIRQKDAHINPNKFNKNNKRMTRSQNKSELSGSKTATNSIIDQNQNNSEQQCSYSANAKSQRIDSKSKNNCNENQKLSEKSVDKDNSLTGTPLKRTSPEVNNSPNKRILRSSGLSVSSNGDVSTGDVVDTPPKRRRYSDNSCSSETSTRITPNNDRKHETSKRIATVYNDLDIFDSITESGRDNDQSGSKLLKCEKKIANNEQTKDLKRTDRHYMQDSILCRMIDKYGTETNIFASENRNDNNRNPCYIKLQNAVKLIVESQANYPKDEMNKLVDELSEYTVQEFTAGFVKYLRDPERKTEMFNKMNIPSAPKMTRTEQILLYVVNKLDSYWAHGEVIETVFEYIEYNLFRLNMTPEFDVIDSLSHFYAILCRYHGYKNRLRQFVLDSMYTMHYKSVAVLRQCIDVWLHIIPLSHMSQAKSPLVVCLVYLLHFHKCKDQHHIVEETRNILQKKYHFDMNEWNEPKIIDYIKSCILDVKDIPTEQKILRTAVIILSKRKGPEWCQKNIIKNILMPTIDDDKLPSWVREFCVSLLGPLMKPFPANMIINCEIVVNQLFDMLEDSCSQKMRESIYTSLTYFGNRYLNRIVRSLLSWQPELISPEFESVIKNFARCRRISYWIKAIKKSVM